MSYRAIAGALALEDVSIGERLVAFSLASYANRAHLAWPAARTGAARAGLGRRQYLAARDRLAARGLIAIEQLPGGPAVRLRFADDGPSIEREINAELFEAMLQRSRTRGGARALVAVLAAFASPEGLVSGVSVDDLCEACGLSERTYRRARSELVAGGEVAIEQAGGGRGCQNVWQIRDPRAASAGADVPVARARPAGGPRQLPLVAVVRDPAVADGRRGRVESDQSHGRGQRSSGNPGINPGVNPGQNCTPPAETPAQTPAQTPAPYAPAGRESQNLRTTPPDPPEGGHTPAVEISERFITARGRSRTRRVHADPRELGPITETDRQAWAAIRERLRERVGESMFEIWLADVEPVAVSRRDGAVLIAAPAQTHSWVVSRYGGLLDALCPGCDRRVRLAEDRELELHAAIANTQVCVPGAPTFSNDHDDRREAL